MIIHKNYSYNFINYIDFNIIDACEIRYRFIRNIIKIILYYEYFVVNITF